MVCKNQEKKKEEKKAFFFFFCSKHTFIVNYTDVNM